MKNIIYNLMKQDVVHEFPEYEKFNDWIYNVAYGKAVFTTDDCSSAVESVARYLERLSPYLNKDMYEEACKFKAYNEKIKTSRMLPTIDIFIELFEVMRRIDQEFIEREKFMKLAKIHPDWVYSSYVDLFGKDSNNKNITTKSDDANLTQKVSTVDL